MPLTRSFPRRAAELAFAGAKPLEHNAFEVALGIETVTDAPMLARTGADDGEPHDHHKQEHAASRYERVIACDTQTGSQR